MRHTEHVFGRWLGLAVEPFTGPRRTTLISESARPAAPCATDGYAALFSMLRLKVFLLIGFGNFGFAVPPFGAAVSHDVS